jgi:maltose alpha-D-glucosyltransferase/alpha-amylase
LAWVRNPTSPAQPVELNLAALEGMTPVEMIGDVRFPTIRREPYVLALGGHSFYWLRVEGRQPRPARYGIEDTAI